MAVLFDLDGTLLDTALDFVAATNKLLELQGLPLVEYQDIKSMISYGIKCIVENIFKLLPTDDKFQFFVDVLLINYQDINFAYTKPFPGVKELLLKLDAAQIPWGIVTNKPGYLTDALLVTQNLYAYTKCIICGDTTAKSKPEPEPLLYASKLIDIQPQDCIYIGDAKHDIIAGNRAGMYTISALYGYIDDHNAALEWPANSSVTTVNEIFPQVYQWHKQKTLIN